MSDQQRKMMRILLRHLDELNKHIKELDEDIDNFMKLEKKQASKAIQDVTGIGSTSTQAIISVIGTDVERFPTDAHIASRAGLCPGNNESARKRKSGEDTERECPVADAPDHMRPLCSKNKKSCFYAQFKRINKHRGGKRAYVTFANSMLIAICHILKDGVAFKDLESDYYNQFNKERKINAYLKKIKALGWELPAVATLVCQSSF